MKHLELKNMLIDLQFALKTVARKALDIEDVIDNEVYHERFGKMSDVNNAVRQIDIELDVIKRLAKKVENEQQ